MKYIIVLCDGMADEPIEELEGRTPLETAKTENLDRLAPVSELGMVRTVPLGMAPGSDTANLSVIGYDPKGILYRTFAFGSFKYRCGYGSAGCFFSL